MNRWRQRLDELRDEACTPPYMSPHTVQNVQNVQKPPLEPDFERYEQNEHRSENTAAASAPIASWGEAQEERAAIVEFDGKIPRTWAEGFARLDPDHPIGDVSVKRWLRFVDDIGRFLDSDFAAVAVALGWGPLDLFGCDRVRPFHRIDHAGLLWLLNGDRLVELDRHVAVIERRTGARQTFRRRPVGVGAVVLAWELTLSRPNSTCEEEGGLRAD